MVAAAISRLLRRQLVANALSLYAVQGLNYLIPLIVLPYLLRTLGPHAYGSIVLAQSLLGYAVILTSFGFNLTASRDISVARGNPAEVAKIYWTTMASKSLLLILSLFGVAMIVLMTPALRSDWRIYLACAPLVLGDVGFPQWYFQGLEKLKDVAMIQAVSKFAIAGATFALVRSPRDVWLAAILSSAPQLCGAAVAALLGRPIAPAVFYRPKLRDIRAALAQSWHVFASSVSTTLYLNTNAFVLGLMRGPTSVAEYGLANRLVVVLQGIATPVTQAVFPRASLLFAERRADAWVLVARVAKIVLPAVALASLLLECFAPQITGLLGGRLYAGAAMPIRIMALNPVLITAVGIPSQIVMVNTGLTKQMLGVYVSVGIVNLALLPVLVSMYAANGAAMSLTLSETLACSLMAWVVWRHRTHLGLPAARRLEAK